MSKRGWCYTLNNYTVEEHEKLQSLACKYHVIGEEEGESGTPHLQGFIYFASAKTFSAAKKVIGERAHIEEMKGTPTQAAEYCRKRRAAFGSMVSARWSPRKRAKWSKTAGAWRTRKRRRLGKSAMRRSLWFTAALFTSCTTKRK